MGPKVRTLYYLALVVQRIFTKIPKITNFASYNIVCFRFRLFVPSLCNNNLPLMINGLLENIYTAQRNWASVTRFGDFRQQTVSEWVCAKTDNWLWLMSSRGMRATVCEARSSNWIERLLEARDGERSIIDFLLEIRSQANGLMMQKSVGGLV